MFRFHHFVQDRGLEVRQARRNTEQYLKKDLSILLKIAHIPDILYLNEDLFVKAGLIERLKKLLKCKCICLSKDRFAEYEELPH